ncbi:ATP-dependent zinc metalloprotease FtsH [Rhizorhapis sp. SPR117]|uniref:ATP-dependent zinc metalloprotease FtsH n=1 Tax=Rhizorhapis sp. SPR117 TaxID=2912611 RepID=UPI001EFF807F|nr:ATP-dependent zinc metalloprotease FtsH [Rhizorhapis sp. SPR117]
MNKFDIAYFIAIIFVVLIIQDFWAGQGHVKTIPFSEFRALVEKNAVTDVVIGPTTITGAYKGAGDKGSGDKAAANGASKPQEQHFTTIRVDPGIADELQKRGIVYRGETPPGFLSSLLSWILPTALFVLAWMFLLRPMASGGQGGLMGIGRSRAKVYSEENVKATFADVAGVDEAKQELSEVIGFLRDPETYGRLGARIPKGVLLVGPPGTGKTLLARAVAGEAHVPFFSITGSEFVEMFVGVGAARVRDMFAQARQQAPAILFIDELDSLGRARGIDLPGAGHDEKEQTLNQLLAEMDGFDPSAGIIVLAATNRPEILDPALLRAGRFDRQVLVDRPDRKGRIEILNVHLHKIRTAPDLDVEAVAGLTPGFTGADLANLVNEAAVFATRRGAEATTLEDFTQAFERVVAGIEKKSRVLSPHERETVAHHEMGHALVAMSLPGTDPVQKVSIIPRGIAALGYTLQRPIEDRFLANRSELMNRMAALLGGRAAEDLIYSDVSTGAADDLQRATDIARSMVVRFGMAPELGQVAYEPETGSFLVGQTPVWRPKAYGDGTAEAIDEAVRKLIDQAFAIAREILECNQALLEGSAKVLLAHETLGPADLEHLKKDLKSASMAGRQTQPALNAVSVS